MQVEARQPFRRADRRPSLVEEQSLPPPPFSLLALPAQPRQWALGPLWSLHAAGGQCLE